MAIRKYELSAEQKLMEEQINMVREAAKRPIVTDDDNPELTYTLPPFQTAAGCFDIISHSMEDYLQTNSWHRSEEYMRTDRQTERGKMLHYALLRRQSGRLNL